LKTEREVFHSIPERTLLRLPHNFRY